MKSEAVPLRVMTVVNFLATLQSVSLWLLGYFCHQLHKKLCRCKHVVFMNRTCVHFQTLLASKPLAGVYEIFSSMYPDIPWQKNHYIKQQCRCHLLFGFHLSPTHVLYMCLQKKLHLCFSLISLCNMCRDYSWNWDKRKSEINPPNQTKSLVYYIFFKL
jgi:hypothetical protein